MLRQRLSRLSEASLRVNDSLDLDAVLQGVLDSARSLTGATYGAMVLLDDMLQVQDSLSSGLTADQAERLWNLANGMRFFEHIGGMTKPVRHGDFRSYVRALGLPEFDSPMPVSSPLAVLIAPVTFHGEPIGIIYLCDSEVDEEFTHADEETLVMFASQAALVIANARFHRDEQRARADLEALVNTAPVGVVVLDAKSGVPTYVNLEMMRIGAELMSSELSAQQMIEAAAIRRSDGSEISFQQFPVAAALSATETVRAEEIVISEPGGNSVTAILNATPIGSDQGDIESFVVTLQDMTPLEHLQRLRAEFLAMVSHELRAPLASIKGSASTLAASRGSLDPSETDLFYRIIEQQADHMSSLITDLLDVARVEAGALSVVPEPVEVAVLVDQAKSGFLSAGGRTSLHIDVPADLPRVNADRRRIVQVLGNLLANAEENSPALSAISLAAQHHGVHVELSVTDHGVGIPADRLSQLFQKFSTPGDKATKTTDSGLGLAIAKGIVEAHGGRIWAQSDGPGTGARFTFSLPAIEAEHLTQPTAAQPSPRSGHTARGPIRVLAVDDDPQTLRYVRDTLTEAGYEPITTGDPTAVSRLLELNRPHLVLLDLMLPGTDGTDLMARVPALSQVPVIFLSAYGRDQTIARALDAGADDYIVKPFSPTELTARIRTVLRRRTADDSAKPSEPYEVGQLKINYAQRRVYLAGRPVQLTNLEYRMLFELSVNAGRTMTHPELLQRVWGPTHSGRTGAVRSVIKNLRHKLGDDANNPTYITNEPRVGYRMPTPPDNPSWPNTS